LMSVGERLGEDAIQKLVKFRSGVPKRKLAKQYGGQYQQREADLEEVRKGTIRRP
jgi:hypothetical protein